MAATVTLATTTLTNGVDPRELVIILASYSGIYPGDRLFVDKELMGVMSLLPNSGGVSVKRGTDGTASSNHSSGAVVTIGKADQFYTSDPMGSPAEATEVAPYINTRNGKVFYAQGDALPAGLTFRWWQDVTTTYGNTSLGIRTIETSPTSST